MCSISNPIVRLGRVISFRPASAGKGLHFDSDQSVRFAGELASKSNYVDHVIAKLRHVLPDALGVARFGDDFEFFPSDSDPIEFANGLIVVKFGDIALRINQREFLIGTSATVCQGERKSKIWSRVSCDSDGMELKAASTMLEFLNVIAEAACDGLSHFYHSVFSEFIAGERKGDQYILNNEYVFQIEAGDYNSSKLFDAVVTFRETASLFSVFDEGDWGPIKDLLELSIARIDDQLHIRSLADVVDDDEISRLSKLFNGDSKALVWEVTLGRHGMFAAEESSIDQKTGAPRTRLVGICSQHSAVQAENNLRSPSWMVSGQLAPKLGANF